MRSTRVASMRSISALTSSMLAQSLALRGAMTSPSRRRNDGVGLDLDEPVRIYETGDFQRAVRGANVAEELSMHSAHGLPMGDVHEVYPRADHVLEARPGISQSLLDGFQNSPSLRRRIANGDRLAAGTGSCAGDRDHIADAHRAREADDRLMRAP